MQYPLSILKTFNLFLDWKPIFVLVAVGRKPISNENLGLEKLE